MVRLGLLQPEHQVQTYNADVNLMYKEKLKSLDFDMKHFFIRTFKTVSSYQLTDLS